MTKKQKTLTVNILAIFAIIFMTVSIIGMTMYHSVLNPNLYKEALYKSEIYTVVSDIIERNISVALVSWEKSLVEQILPGDAFNNELANNAVTFVLNTVVEQQTPQLVSNVFEKIGLAEVFQNVVEKKVDNDIAWLRGEKEMKEIFTYIPTPEQIEGMKDSSFTQLLDQFVKDSLTDTEELAACGSDVEVKQNIALINAGDAKNITCTSQQVEAMLTANFEDSRVKILVNRMGGRADELAQNSRVDALLTDVQSLSLALAEIKQSLINTRSMVQGVLKTSKILFWLSIILSIIAIVMQQRGKQVKQFITIIFATGVSITIFALLYYMVLIHFVIGSIPFETVTFSTNALTATEGVMLVNSLQFVMNYIAKGIIYLTFVFGVWTTVIGGLLYGWLAVFKNRKKILRKFNIG